MPDRLFALVVVGAAVASGAVHLHLARLGVSWWVRAPLALGLTSLLVIALLARLSGIRHDGYWPGGAHRSKRIDR